MSEAKKSRREGEREKESKRGREEETSLDSNTFFGSRREKKQRGHTTSCKVMVLTTRHTFRIVEPKGKNDSMIGTAFVKRHIVVVFQGLTARAFLR